jgi:hypothetical protein
MTNAAEQETVRRTPRTLKAVPSFPWSTVSVTVRTAVAIWVAIRLLASVVGMFRPNRSFPFLGTVQIELILFSIVVGLTLFEIRRMNERVFFQDLGLSEVAVGAISLVTVLLCQILLFLAVATPMGS